MNLKLYFKTHGLTKEAYKEYRESGKDQIPVTRTTAWYQIGNDGSIYRKRMDSQDYITSVAPAIKGCAAFPVTSTTVLTKEYRSIDEIFQENPNYRDYNIPWCTVDDYHDIQAVFQALNPKTILFSGYEAIKGNPLAAKVIIRALSVKLEHCAKIEDSEVFIQTMDEWCRYSSDCYDTSQENYALHYIPKVSLVDEISFVLDFSDEKGHFFLSRDNKPEEEVKLSAIQPYFKFINIQRKNYDCPFLSFGASFESSSLNTIVKSFRRYPMLRTFFKTYGEQAIGILRAFHIGGFDDIPCGFMEYTTPAKALGISNQVMKIVVDLHSRGDHINIRGFDQLKGRINPQVFDAIILEFSKTLVLLKNDNNNRCSRFNESAKLIATIIRKYGGEKGNKYNFVRLMRYISDEVYTYQGISSPKEAVQLLSDYYNMMDNMDAKITEWFPKSLKLIHDIAARNQDLVIEEVRQRKFAKAVQEPEYQALKYEDEDWVVLAPETANDIINEGQRQSHCVGSYVNYVSNGEKYILFMRRAADPNTSVITLDVDPNTKTLTQYRGFGNRNPSEEEMQFIKKWAKKKKLTIS